MLSRSGKSTRSELANNVRPKTATLTPYNLSLLFGYARDFLIDLSLLNYTTNKFNVFSLILVKHHLFRFDKHRVCCKAVAGNVLKTL
jgi:hypothetical protein